MVSSKTQAEAPIRSLDQRMEALKRANDIRVRRARLKKDLKDGRVQIEQDHVRAQGMRYRGQFLDLSRADHRGGLRRLARLKRAVYNDGASAFT